MTDLSKCPICDCAPVRCENHYQQMYQFWYKCPRCNMTALRHVPMREEESAAQLAFELWNKQAALVAEFLVERATR